MFITIYLRITHKCVISYTYISRKTVKMVNKSENGIDVNNVNKKYLSDMYMYIYIYIRGGHRLFFLI